ncbi:phosphatidylinositide phosphatase sac2 [Plakobranchus ocellatus]|uniref:Phosphatidylinositide phosphatase sac2 n=1 Tax=Plakobranchus ocellatus TaxID=259542 RepID=A0AAV3YK76_9GAST|nr:phosphatidylinositide phosphatase sac2 [Plakobranchus ocellatus]
MTQIFCVCGRLLYSCSELANAWNPVCVGQVFGVIGKVKLHPDSEWRLLLIKQRTPVCQLAGKHTIYRIDKMAVLPLNTTDACSELDLEVNLDITYLHII